MKKKVTLIIGLLFSMYTWTKKFLYIVNVSKLLIFFLICDIDYLILIVKLLKRYLFIEVYLFSFSPLVKFD